jgi:hypothetical protein
MDVSDLSVFCFRRRVKALNALLSNINYINTSLELRSRLMIRALLFIQLFINYSILVERSCRKNSGISPSPAATGRKRGSVGIFQPRKLTELAEWKPGGFRFLRVHVHEKCERTMGLPPTIISREGDETGTSMVARQEATGAGGGYR